MNEQCMSKVNHKISVLSVRARRPDGGERQVKSYEKKNREKNEGRIRGENSPLVSFFLVNFSPALYYLNATG